MSAAELLAVGETMGVLTPRDGSSLTDADDFLLDAGGAESNVAAHVAALRGSAAWFSRLGDDELGDRIVAQLRGRGVEVDSVVRDARHPTGLYLKQPGRGVVYYRAGSAAAQLAPDDVDLVPWGSARILHVSGITAAISASARSFLDALFDAAQARGIEVSFDVNHRPVLWPDADAATVLDGFARRAQIVFVGRDEAEGLWGTASAAQIRNRFADVAELVIKDAEHGATGYAAADVVFEPSEVVEVLDAVGAGDAFAGGYLAHRLSGAPLAERLRAGHRRAALTLTTAGDSVAATDVVKEEAR